MMCSQCEMRLDIMDGHIRVHEVYRHSPSDDVDLKFCSITCLQEWYQ